MPVLRPAPPAAPTLRRADVLLAGLGAGLALSLVGALAAYTGQPWLLGSFGASCVLLFGFPESVFAQPRSVLGGHCLASLVALLWLHLLGDGWLALGLCCAVVLMLMMLTGTVHPPAGGNPVIVFMLRPGWDFLVLPTLLGAGLLVLSAWVYWRVVKRPRSAARP